MQCQTTFHQSFVPPFLPLLRPVLWLCSQIPCPKDGPSTRAKTTGYEIQCQTTFQRSFVPPFLLLLRPVLWLCSQIARPKDGHGLQTKTKGCPGLHTDTKSNAKRPSNEVWPPHFCCCSGLRSVVPRRYVSPFWFPPRLFLVVFRIRLGYKCSTGPRGNRTPGGARHRYDLGFDRIWGSIPFWAHGHGRLAERSSTIIRRPLPSRGWRLGSMCLCQACAIPWPSIGQSAGEASQGVAQAVPKLCQRLFLTGFRRAVFGPQPASFLVRL